MEMNGMLWFDNDKKRTLAEKIKRAADYFNKKYGRVPNVCFVNKGVIEAVEMPGIKVRPSGIILPNHFLVGMEEA
jgi:hypothetical protein